MAFTLYKNTYVLHTNRNTPSTAKRVKIVKISKPYMWYDENNIGQKFDIMQHIVERELDRRYVTVDGCLALRVSDCEVIE